jgi:hypothetical protein
LGGNAYQRRRCGIRRAVAKIQPARLGGTTSAGITRSTTGLGLLAS